MNGVVSYNAVTDTDMVRISLVTSLVIGHMSLGECRAHATWLLVIVILTQTSGSGVTISPRYFSGVCKNKKETMKSKKHAEEKVSAYVLTIETRINIHGNIKDSFKN